MGDETKIAINAVKVDRWKPNENDKNNCYWNIAKNQLGEGASAAEIAKLTEQIQTLTEQKNSAIAARNGMLYENDQVFLPLELAMDEITTSVTTKQTELSQAQTTITAANEALTTANGDVASKLSAYQSAQAQLQAADPESDDYASLKSAAETAKTEYTNALTEQKAKQTEAEQAKADLEAKQQEITELQEELSNIKAEYDSDKEQYEAELKQIDEQISGLGEQIDETQTQIAEAQTTAQTAQNSLNAATELGATFDDEGNALLETDPSAEQLTLAEYANKEVAETKIIDGGRTKSVTYADGSSAEFYRDSETGQFSAIPGITYSAAEDETAAPEAENTQAEDEKEIASTKIIDGGRTKVVTYADGSSAEFYRDPATGQFKTEPGMVYEAKTDETASDENFAGPKMVGASTDSLSDDATMPDNITEALVSVQNGIGGEYLQDSEYYKGVSNKLITQKDDNGLVIAADEQQKMYSELKSVESQIASLKGTVDSSNTEAYNEQFAKYCEDMNIDLTKMYLDKIDNVGVKQASDEMQSYVKNISDVLGARKQTDEKWETTTENLNPTQKLMLKEQYGTDDIKTCYRYDLAVGDASYSLPYYNGNSEYDDIISKTLNTYNEWSNVMDEITSSYDVNSHLKNQGSENDEKAQELIELYNEFVDNYYEGGFIFKNDDDKLKERAESLIKNYLYGSLTDYDIDSTIRSLKAQKNS